MINLHEVIEACKAEAIANRLAPTEESNWRYFCREYSKTFHTPLHLVLQMSAEEVLLPLFEEQMAKKNLEVPEEFDSLVEDIRRLEDPNYDENSKKETDEFVEAMEAFEEERIRTGGKIPNRFSKKKTSEKPKEESKNPKQGFVDLSRFANETEES